MILVKFNYNQIQLFYQQCALKLIHIKQKNPLSALICSKPDSDTHQNQWSTSGKCIVYSKLGFSGNVIYVFKKCVQHIYVLRICNSFGLSQQI